MNTACGISGCWVLGDYHMVHRDRIPAISGVVTGCVVVVRRRAVRLRRVLMGREANWRYG